MKLGLMWGYWGQLPPPDVIGVDPGGRAARLRLGVDRRGVGLRRLLAARLDRRPHLHHQARHRVVQLVGPHADGHRDGRHHHRPHLERPVPCSGSACRARRWSRAGTAGRRTSRWPAPASTSRSSAGCCAARSRSTSRASSTSTPTTAPGSVGLGKPLKADHPPAAPRHPDLPRRRGPEERGHDRRDRRRLAAALLLAVPPATCTPTRWRAPGPDFDIVAGAQVNINDDVEAGPDAGEDDDRLLHRRHGRQGPELPHQAHGAVRLRGGGAQDPGAVLRGPARRGHRRRPRRVRRRHLARRPRGTHPGTAGRRGTTAPCRRCSSTPPAATASARSPTSSSADLRPAETPVEAPMRRCSPSAARAPKGRTSTPRSWSGSATRRRRSRSRSSSSRAAATKPSRRTDEFADSISLVGPPARIKERLQAWDDSPVSTLLVYSPGRDRLGEIADLVLG